MDLDDANLIRLIALKRFSAWLSDAFGMYNSLFVVNLALCSYMM